MNKPISWAIAAFGLILLHLSQGQAQEPFYKGKTITILAGTGAGNVYDIFARLFARHMGSTSRGTLTSSSKTCPVRHR